MCSSIRCAADRPRGRECGSTCSTCLRHSVLQRKCRSPSPSVGVRGHSTRSSRRLTGWARDRLPVRQRGKSGLPANVLTMPLSPWILRRTAMYRFSNVPARTADGDSPATAFVAPADPIYLRRPSRCEQVADPGPPDEPPPRLRSDDGMAGAERLFAPRHATVGKTVRERFDRRRR